MHSIHYTLYSVHCTLYTVHYTLYTVHFTRYTINCTVITAHSILYSEQFSHQTAHFILHIGGEERPLLGSGVISVFILVPWIGWWAILGVGRLD